MIILDLRKEPLDVILKKVLCDEIVDNPNLDTAFNMLRIGNYRFNPDEMEQLFTKEIWWKCSGTIAFQLASTGMSFSFDTLVKYGNPACLGEWTIAHEMAKNGYMFSIDELLQLRNPIDTRGLTVADVMMINGHKFSPVEETQLEIDLANFEYSAYAAFDLKNYFEKEPEQPTICPKCGRNFSRTDVEISKTVDNLLDSDPIPIYYYSYLFLCDQCHWWCVRERWAEAERFYDGDLLLIGVARNRKLVGLTDPNPWIKALAYEYAYTHDLKMPFDLYQMFPKKTQST